MDDFMIESVCLVRAEHVSGAEQQNFPLIAPFRGDF